MVLVLVYYLNSYFICRSKDIKSEYLFPAWTHAIRPLNYLCMLNLIRACAHLLIDHDLNHGLKAIRVKKLIIKLSIHDIEGQCRSLHYWYSVYPEARVSLL